MRPLSSAPSALLTAVVAVIYAQAYSAISAPAPLTLAGDAVVVAVHLHARAMGKKEPGLGAGGHLRAMGAAVATDAGLPPPGACEEVFGCPVLSYCSFVDEMELLKNEFRSSILAIKSFADFFMLFFLDACASFCG